MNKYVILLPKSREHFGEDMKNFPDEVETRFYASDDEARSLIQENSVDMIFLDKEASDELVAAVDSPKEDGSLTVIRISDEIPLNTDLPEDSVLHVPEEATPMEFAAQLLAILQYHKLKLQLAWEKTNRARERSLLTQYFSEDIVEKLLNDRDANHFGGKKQEVTILFFDIRNSTGLGEKLEPQILASFLSEFFTDVMDLIYGNRGSVNKMLGDGIMATFGAPLSTGQDVLNAVRCAVQIREHLDTFNDVRPDYLEEPIRFGIGIATGKVFAGNIGSVRRMEYTVLGDPVNTAARLESMTKKAGVDILIDGSTREKLGNLVKVKKVALQNVRGKQESIDIYYLESVLN